MAEYKLYYFNVTGLAEPIRYLLHYCGIHYQDIRFNDFDEWLNQYKQDMPMEQVPVLEIDGVKYHQHKSICRYIARKHDLCGSCDEESLEMDAVVDDIEDMRMFLANFYKEEDSAFKAQLKERMLEKIPFFLDRFEFKVKNNNGYFFGNNKISWVDIYYAGICEILSNILKYDLNINHPNLKMLINTVHENDKIRAYLETRPKTNL